MTISFVIETLDRKKIEMFWLIFLLFPIVAFYYAASWTSDEASYVFSLFLHHPVHLGWLCGFLINLFSGGFGLAFDIVVFVLRSAGAI